MTWLYPVYAGAAILVLHALAFLWLRWRQRKHRFMLRGKDGSLLQVAHLGPFKRRRVRR